MRRYTKGWVVVNADSGQSVDWWAAPVGRDVAERDRDQRNAQAAMLGIRARYTIARVVIEIEEADHA